MTLPKVEITSKSKEQNEAEQIVKDNIVVYKTLAGMKAAIYNPGANDSYATNPWTASDVDKYAARDLTKEYRESVDSCRFFYRRDPIASVVINKLVELAITQLQLVQGKVPANQFRVYESYLNDLQDFSEDCALEYLTSGLLIPEVDFVEMPRKELQKRGIKAYESLTLPETMWIRDPETIIINSPLVINKPSYYVEIPEELRAFIKSEGVYADGTEDKELYWELVKLYPEFVRAINDGKTKVKLDNPFVLRRKYLSDSPYPIPYLYPAIESLRHKRNIRRMDYSVAARVISAIMQVKVGDSEFPLVDEDDTQLRTLEQQMRWRDSSNSDIERIFQLFTNHTVEISWVYPDTAALLDDTKYESINFDILYALGLPNILVSGETQRSQTSTADGAMISPTKTMENLQRKIIRVAEKIIESIAENNIQFKDTPIVRFAPMNLHTYKAFLEGLVALYTAGNLSRTSWAKELGYEFEEEVNKRAEEDELLESLDVQEFAPVPFSAEPQQAGDTDEPQETDETE